jgi:hypothetical protein
MNILVVAMALFSWTALGQFAPIPLFGGTVVKMVADFQRPYIYAIEAPTSGMNNGILLFINVTNGTLVKTLPIGSNPTDLTINVAEGRLYVANWGSNITYVVDLTTQTTLPSFALGTDVSKINAIKAGRLFTEGQNNPPSYTCYFNFVNTVGGTNIYPPNAYAFISAGDGKADSIGTFYYHCDQGLTPAYIHKYQINNEILGQVANNKHQDYGTHNLVLSHDDSRIFWDRDVFDANLNNLGTLGAEIYACSANGAVAFSAVKYLIRSLYFRCIISQCSLR